MRMMQIFLSSVGRIFLSLIFILSAVHKILDWQGSQQKLTNSLCDWMCYSYNSVNAQNFLQFLLPWAPVLLALGFAFELVGGLLVLLGIKVRLGAFLLILFLIPTSFLFHHFWFLKGTDAQLHMVMFLKNLSILGALFIFLANGKGAARSDALSE